MNGELIIITRENGIGVSDTLEIHDDEITAQGILIALLNQVDFEYHKAEPPTLKKIRKYLKRWEKHNPTSDPDPPELFLCQKHPEAFKEYFSLAYEIEDPNKGVYGTNFYRVRGQDCKYIGECPNTGEHLYSFQGKTYAFINPGHQIRYKSAYQRALAEKVLGIEHTIDSDKDHKFQDRETGKQI